MYRDLAVYFYENVVTRYKEHLDIKNNRVAGRIRDILTAITAATALYHLREHLPSNKKPTWKQIITSCPDYNLLRDVVNLAKHGSITKYKPQVSDIEELVIITEYQDSEGKYRYVEKTVQVYLVDGTKRDLLEIMTNVMNYWQRYLHSIEVITEPHYYNIPPFDHKPKTREECGNSNLGLEVVRGLNFMQSFCLQRYNYEIGEIEPVDLTGCEITSRIYKPNFEVEIAFTHNVTGERVFRTIQLTEEENQQLIRIKADEEKQAYVNQLPAYKKAMQQLVAEIQSREST